MICLIAPTKKLYGQSSVSNRDSCQRELVFLKEDFSHCKKTLSSLLASHIECTEELEKNITRYESLVVISKDLEQQVIQLGNKAEKKKYPFITLWE